MNLKKKTTIRLDWKKNNNADNTINRLDELI